MASSTQLIINTVLWRCLLESEDASSAFEASRFSFFSLQVQYGTMD